MPALVDRIGRIEANRGKGNPVCPLISILEDAEA
jgi:hypothetical protein